MYSTAATRQLARDVCLCVAVGRIGSTDSMYTSRLRPSSLMVCADMGMSSMDIQFVSGNVGWIVPPVVMMYEQLPP